MYAYQPDRSLKGRLKAFIKESGRVLRITKKPSKDEFLTILKVTAIGTVIIGLIGFIVYMVVNII